MREIKFKAWGCFGSMEKNQMIYNWETSEFIEYIGFDGGNAFEIMQYTGLKDKNGKEIYEGDILGWEEKGSNKHKVFWNNERSAFRTISLVKPAAGLESRMDEILRYAGIKVIGNIYENPELLKP